MKLIGPLCEISHARFEAEVPLIAGAFAQGLLGLVMRHGYNFQKFTGTRPEVLVLSSEEALGLLRDPDVLSSLKYAAATLSNDAPISAPDIIGHLLGIMVVGERRARTEAITL